MYQRSIRFVKSIVNSLIKNSVGNGVIEHYLLKLKMIMYLQL